MQRSRPSCLRGFIPPHPTTGLTCGVMPKRWKIFQKISPLWGQKGQEWSKVEELGEHDHMRTVTGID